MAELAGRLAASVLFACGAMIDAAEPERSRINVFVPGFFAEFNPNTAHDVIERIPGFAYDKGDNDLRGLADAGGNVLIDGQRPSTKSLDLDDVLRRIPFSAIERIEIIRGDAPGMDLRGQSVVANIIRNAGAAASAAVELMTKFYDDHTPARSARIEGSRAGRLLSVEGALQWHQEKEQDESGIGHLVRRDAAGALTSSGRFEADWDREQLAGSGAAELRHGADFLRLSLSGEREREDRLDKSSLRDAAGIGLSEIVVEDVDSAQGAISVEYEREVSDRLTLRMLVLESRERDQIESTSTGRGAEQISSEESLAGESIVRAAATFLPGRTVTLDASIERAFNFLDAESSLATGGVPVLLPAADVRVEERRVEAALGLRWQAGDGATLEAGLAHETSPIVQRGDVQRSRSLRFLKPRFSATLEPADEWQLRLRVERVVSQLDFEDFASTASLDAGTIDVGNPDLTPEQAWQFELAIERRFWSDAAATLTLGHSRLNDVIDLIPIQGRFDAPGNIGTGRRDELRFALTLPLDRLGTQGMLIRFNANLRRSSVTDPVTLEQRGIASERPFEGDLSLTKQLPGLRSVIGSDFYFGHLERSYRINEIRTDRISSDPLARTYWDWTPRPGTSFRFQIENINFRSRSYDRTRYTGPRNEGRLASSEHRDAVLDPFVMIRMRMNF
jgi:TonB dependent receptor